jgi:hypothetical protein
LTSTSCADSASRRAWVTKQRSKCGQRAPIRASGVVVTSAHTGASSASQSSSARSPVAVSVVHDVIACSVPSVGFARHRLGELAPAEVVADALEHDDGERPVDDGAEKRDVVARDLILQRARARRDHHALAALQRRDQIRERLARAGAGLDDQRALVGERTLDRGGHQALLGAILVVRDRAIEGAAGREDVAHALAGRAAFSSWPLTPNRRPSSRHTASTGTSTAASPTRTWNSRSAVSWTTLSVATVGAASSAVSSPCSSTILPTILPIPTVEERPGVALGRGGLLARRDHLGQAIEDVARRRAVVVAVGGAEEARRRAGVAGRAVGPRRHQDRVAIAVEADLDHAQHMTRGLALLPQRAARARPEVDVAGGVGQGPGLGVHPRQHEHGAAVGVGHDRRR